MKVYPDLVDLYKLHDRVLKADPKIQIADSRKIVDTRNRIIHGYDVVSDDVIWLIINKSLPALEKEIKILLKEQTTQLIRLRVAPVRHEPRSTHERSE